MEEWLKKKSDIQRELKETKKKIRRDIKEHTREYDEKKALIERQMQLDIQNLDKRYEELKTQKENQDRQNQDAMIKMEQNHVQAVEDLQDAYEKKIYIEQSNYLKLEQEKMEMKNYYENKINELKR